MYQLIVTGILKLLITIVKPSFLYTPLIMTDYQEDQANELEALESIYPEELNLISVTPFASFIISLTAEYSQGYGEGDQVEDCTCDLLFTYTETYPDTAPEYEITKSENLDGQQQQLILDLMKDTFEENLGMASVFTVVAAVQEQLLVLMENTHTEKRLAKERAIEEAEEAERKRFEGTRVTVETFMAWKTKFDEELAEIKRKKGQVDLNCNKLSGYELFMTDSTMDESDVQFLEEGDTDAVAVDESLFDELDDLELEDDLEV